MPQFRNILAIDSAMNGCGAALYCPDDLASCVSERLPMVRGQAEALVPLAQDVVKTGRKTFADIDLVCTTIGPGTFTGLRVGMSAARSFALALDVPVVGISTLDVLAGSFFETQPDLMTEGDMLCVLIETKRSDYYAGFYDASGVALDEPMALDGADIQAKIGRHKATGQIVMIGDATGRFVNEQRSDGAGLHVIHEGYTQPDPLVLARMGYRRATDPAFSVNTGIEPLYLRGADVSQPKTPPRILASE